MSFSIIRTKVGLTGNIKFLTDGRGIWINSINSSPQLNIDSLKWISINDTTDISRAIPNFLRGVPRELVFKSIDWEGINTSQNLHDQFSELYWSGLKTNDSENREFFTTLWVEGEIPDGFILFKSNGSGVGEKFSDYWENLRVYKFFDTGLGNPLGNWLDLNFNRDIPHSLDFSFGGNFTLVSGIDIETGGYVTKSKFQSDFLRNERGINGFERDIYELYEKMGIIHPRMLNISFLFSDVDSDWEFNRWTGFWTNLKLHTKLTARVLPQLRGGISIESGIFSEYPFIDDNLSVDDMWVEYGGDYYKVEPFVVTSKGLVSLTNSDFTDITVGDSNEIKWRVISDVDITMETISFNTNSFSLDKNIDLDPLLKYIIKVGSNWHIIRGNVGGFELITDYKLEINEDSIRVSYNEDVEVIDRLNSFPIFSVFQLDFLDIKDFDNRIINSDYTNYEGVDINSEEIKNFQFPNSQGVASSEYIASLELFENPSENELSQIWNPDQEWVKWGYKGSNSINDLPYRLNNTLQFENWNKSPNLINEWPDRQLRNLDWFYSVGDSPGNTWLHIPNFNIIDYISYDLDYFKINLGGYTANLDSKFNKFSVVIDNSGNETLFKGIKFRLWSVDSTSVVGDKLLGVNASETNRFKDWKFSVILTDNPVDWDLRDNYKWDWFESFGVSGGKLVIFSNKLPNLGDLVELSGFDTRFSVIGVNTDENYFILDVYYMDISTVLGPGIWKSRLALKPIREWEDFLSVKSGDLLDWRGLLITSIEDQELGSTPDFSKFTYLDSPFWYPGTTASYVYYGGEWWLESPTGSVDFWSPTQSYSVSDRVFYWDKFYIKVNNLSNDPETSSWSVTRNDMDFKWVKIGFNNLIDYRVGELGELFKLNGDGVYEKIESLIGGKSLKRGDIVNRYGNLFRCINSGDINSNIDIYFNFKYNNILINVNINDSTIYDSLGKLDYSKSLRENLYNSLNNKITALNFITALENPTDDYGFMVRWFKIDELGNISRYSINDLEWLITISDPDNLELNKNSLIWVENTLDIPQLVGLIDNPISWRLRSVDETFISPKNYNSQDVSLTETIWRYSGPYEPIFYNIDIWRDFDVTVDSYEIQILLGGDVDVSNCGHYTYVKLETSLKSNTGSTIDTFVWNDDVMRYEFVDGESITYIRFNDNKWEIVVEQPSPLFSGTIAENTGITGSWNILTEGIEEPLLSYLLDLIIVTNELGVCVKNGDLISNKLVVTVELGEDIETGEFIMGVNNYERFINLLKDDFELLNGVDFSYNILTPMDPLISPKFVNNEILMIKSDKKFNIKLNF